MAKKRKKRTSRNKKVNKRKTKRREKRALKQETLHTIISILLLALGLLFILAPLNLAGLVGEKTYEGLASLFGVGYFLFPLIFFIVASALLRAIEVSLNQIRIWAAILFFASSLSIISIAFFGSGGTVGELLSKPLLFLFDTYASLVLLWAIVFVSLLAIFDEKPSLESFPTLLRIFGKKEGDEEIEAYEDVEVSVPEEPEDDSEVEGEEEKEESSNNEEKEDKSAGKEKEENGGFSGLFKRGSEKKVDAFDDNYATPPLSLLEKRSGKPEVGDIKANANIIKRTLANFGINVEMDEVSIGPSVTRYALKPAEGVRLSKILSLQNNLELALAAHPVRIEAPIPGKSLVGIEVPNTSKSTVGIASILSSAEFKSSSKPLSIALGRGISGSTYTASIARMPHLLIAGATGSGKSVTIHALVTSLLYRHSPAQLKFIMIDPKRVELTLYNNIPHLLTPVITDAKKSILALKWAAQEMERRYDILEEHKVRDLSSYHENVLKPARDKDFGEDEEAPPALPYIVIIIDELADIMQAYPRELESAIVRLAQMSRAVGIHLVLSTQRPSVNVITGLIKANIPTRVALQVASQVDSRTILDTSGAEKLLGAGDMLYLSADMSKPVRIQSAFISEDEVKRVVNHLKKNYEEEIPDDVVITDDSPSAEEIFESASEAEEEDELYEEAREIVVKAGKGSTSYLQRKLRVGYSRAARLMDMLEENGVVAEQEGSKAREVLVDAPSDDYDPHEESGDDDDEEDEY